MSYSKRERIFLFYTGGCEMESVEAAYIAGIIDSEGTNHSNQETCE
ncbi:hypothetical protein KIS4809_2142 [Bacillus sp. ZZV12-4809]|nr:hypothetical protein KIS4809_2142 [Bacillus sp. ZZV12-4809]